MKKTNLYRFLTVGAYLSRHLEGSTADTTALDLDLRSNVHQGFFPDLECGSFLVAKFGLDNLESVIEYGVSCVLFSVIHQVVDELGDAHVVEHGIG